MRSWIENQYLRELLSEENTGPDFYYDEHGNTVFTESFHKKRGFCCKNGCKHCPFKEDFNTNSNVIRPV